MSVCHAPLSSQKIAPPHILIALTILLFGSLSCRALGIQERTLPAFGNGPVKFTCLQIDGGVVPLRPPPNVRLVRHEGSLTIVWPMQKGFATIATATAAESHLLDKTGSPLPKELWLKTIWQQIDGSVVGKSEVDFQTNIIDVNHWKMSAISVAYTIGGVQATHVLLVWRCRDGQTLAIQISSTPTDLKDVRKQLYEMIGSTLVLPS